MDKKELIKQYKQTVPPMGIYQIRCLTNNKIFIGSTKNLHGKQNSYEFQLKAGTHMNKSLQQDYKALGSSNFVFEILDTLPPNDDLKYDYTEDLAALEDLWLQKLARYSPEVGYNKPKMV